VTFTTSGGVVSGNLPGIAPSATVACTLVNQPLTTLTLVKSVAFGAAAATDWALSATGPAGALAGPNGRTGTAATTAVPVTPGRAYRLAESGGLATYVQTGPWTCVDAAGAAVAVSGAGDVTLATGAAVTCTVANATATITLLAQVIPPGGGLVPSAWTVTAAPAPFAGGTLATQTRTGADYDPVAGNRASTFEVRPGHGYTLSEAVTATGSRLSYQLLRLERLDGTTWVPVSGAGITAPAAGQTAVYRFVNAPVAPPRLPVTGGMGADAFLLAGSAVLALVLAAAVARVRLRRGRWGS
jgi:hypothetical protein